jgi:hypothetical protein
MFSVELKSLIVFLVDKMLDRDSNKIERVGWENGGVFRRPGLYMSFPVTVSDDDYDEYGENTSITRTVYLVFTGHTSVWYTVTDDMRYNPKPEDFINSSNHNSCWRTDGLQFLSNLYFDMCKEVNPNKAPKDLQSELNWIIWTDVKQCEVIFNSSPDNDYRQVLVKYHLHR